MRGADRSPLGARTVLVTGAGGFVGSRLVERFRAARRLVAISRPGGSLPIADARIEDPTLADSLEDSGHEKPVVEHRRIDLTDHAELDALLEAVRPEAIVHLAAMSRIAPCEERPDACRRINVDVVEQIAGYAARSGCHLTHLSTDFVFDGRQRGGLDEDSPTGPTNVYGRSKLEAERAIRASGARAAILRTVLVHGPRSPFVALVRSRLVEGRELPLYADHWRTPTFVDDLVDAIEATVSREALGVYHVAGEDYLTVCELGRRIARALGLVDSLVLEDRSPPTDVRPPRTGFIIDRARRVLGFRPRPLGAALRTLRTDSPVEDPVS